MGTNFSGKMARPRHIIGWVTPPPPSENGQLNMNENNSVEMFRATFSLNSWAQNTGWLSEAILTIKDALCYLQTIWLWAEIVRDTISESL